MSTYTNIQGSVWLDAAAARNFYSSESWNSWCGPEAEESGITVTYEPEGAIHLDFDGSSFRNLCRYLDFDLYAAQQHGEVMGLIVSDCQDGGHERAVTRFDGRTVVYGRSECFNAPLALHPVVGGEMQFRDFTIPQFVKADDGREFIYFNAGPELIPCACGGYENDDYENGAICTAKPRP